MQTEYSKPAGDVGLEAQKLLDEDAVTLARQRRISAALENGVPREKCILCGSGLNTPRRFTHRGVDYARCDHCAHIQTVVHPPAGYPHRDEDRLSYSQIYHELDADAYASRRDRIYLPKLDWVTTQLVDAGWSEQRIASARWLEVGAGAGYFLDALRMRGVSGIAGLERDADLVNRANRALGGNVVERYDQPLTDAMFEREADIVAAFFVIEHFADPAAFWGRLASLPAGTVFVFSVPCHGFAAVLETAFPDYAARCLDNVVHTQLYTDESIAFALRLAGMRAMSTWHFGQDAIDLRRLVLLQLRDRYTPEMMDAFDVALLPQLDALQQVIDRAHLSDSRHVIAVREG